LVFYFFCEFLFIVGFLNKPNALEKFSSIRPLFFRYSKNSFKVDIHLFFVSVEYSRFVLLFILILVSSFHF